mgnify:CR=1 FL=1|tara:strand:+ start:211 stop:897 length:687 start_codon:yes stop_codon:yes gene_type:complete
MSYSGWELKFFDASGNFRKYQFSLIKDFVGKKVLEVGPGTGEFAKKYLLKKSEQLVLTEISENLNQSLQKQFKDSDKEVRILSRKIVDIDEDFDTICYFDVVEHIENHEEEIHQAFKKLKKDGHLIIIVPAFNHLYSNFDKSLGHYRRYEKKFFSEFAKKNNLVCKKLFYFDIIGYFFLLVNRIINTKTQKKVAFATFLWNLLIPISRIIDKITFHSVGKSLVCILKK